MELWRTIIDNLLLIVPGLAGCLMAAGFIFLMFAGDNPYRTSIAINIISRALVGLIICFAAVAVYELLSNCTGSGC